MSRNYFSSRLLAEHVPSLAPGAVDQLGCGDALLAAVTLAMISGGSLPIATILGGVAAAIEAQKLGNAVIGAADLRRGITRLLAAKLTFDPEPCPAMVQCSSDQLSIANT